MGARRGSIGHTDSWPPGVQPESDLGLQCLECGRSYRQLGQHVVRAHQISADEYRRRHELPASRGLHAADLRARRAARARAAYEADPAFRERNLTPTRTTPEQRIARSRAARADTLTRAGVQAVSAITALRLAQTRQAEADAPLQARAIELGYGGITELLEDNAATPTRRLAELLGIPDHRVRALRRRFGFRSPGRWAADYKATSRRHRPRVPPAELALITVGVQPEREGFVLCLKCGRWVRPRGLPQHLARTHQITTAVYRAAYELDPHTGRARELGFLDLPDMLAATAHLSGRDFAGLLGLTLPQARAVRRGYGYRTPRTTRASSSGK